MIVYQYEMCYAHEMRLRRVVGKRKMKFAYHIYYMSLGKFRGSFHITRFDVSVNDVDGEFAEKLHMEFKVIVYK